MDRHAGADDDDAFFTERRDRASEGEMGLGGFVFEERDLDEGNIQGVGFRGEGDVEAREYAVVEAAF